MKRIAASLLALVLLLSLLPFAGAAFTDADKIAADNQKAVEYVSSKGVISGFPDGSFKPADTLTRAQAAKILCVALEGADAANALAKTDTGFTDVPASHWAAKFIAYCVDKGVVAGVGNNKFNPDGFLTAAAFAKMLLVAYNRADAKTLVGDKWVLNTQKAMRTDGLNDGVAVPNAPITRENACRMAYNFLVDADIAAAEPEAYRQTTFSFTGGGNYRLLGRAKQTSDGVLCDWTGDGVEFTVNCKGTVTVSWYIDAVGTWEFDAFRVVVDGTPGKRMSLTAVGEATKDAYLRVMPGEHTIRIVKEREVSSVTNLLKSMTLTCTADGTKATQARKKLLVSIGDSTSAGYGTDPTSTPSSTKNSCSAVFNYTYLTAEALGMDYEMNVKGTTGLVKQYGTPNPYNQREFYEYQNRYRDDQAVKNGKRTGEAERYGFPRKADAVIIKISNNDNSAPKETEEAALKEMIRTLRQIHGEKTPVVLLFFSSNTHVETADRLAAEDPLIVCVRAVYDGKGMGGHTSAATHVQTAERLVEALKPLV